MGDILKMNQKELERIEILQKVVEYRLSKKDAAKLMHLSYGHTKRLVKKYRKEGAKGIISQKRGKKSNRAFSDSFKEKVHKLVAEKYPDFKPTFAAEKLREHQVFLSRETLRIWMIEWGLWRREKSKKAKIHQQRARRSCFGELIQIDGSPHDWFEGRNDKCCLIVFVDDATSRIVQMLFVPVENTQAYLKCIKLYIKTYGRPLAFYSDRHSIFRVNNGEGGERETQFKRAMKELGIQLICANSPQAKGKVERANLTLQDRLVKELRLRNISDIEAGNKYLEEFRKEYNKKFGKPPASEKDLHIRSIPDDAMLDFILAERYTRTLSKNLEFHFENAVYQIIVKKGQVGYGLRRAKVTICRHLNGEITLLYKGRKLEYKRLGDKQGSVIVDSKEVNAAIDKFLKIQKIEDQPWNKVKFLKSIEKKLGQLAEKALE